MGPGEIILCLFLVIVCWLTIRAQERRHHGRLWESHKAQQEQIRRLTRENMALHRENALLRQGKPTFPAISFIEPEPYRNRQ